MLLPRTILAKLAKRLKDSLRSRRRGRGPLSFDVLEVRVTPADLTPPIVSLTDKPGAFSTGNVSFSFTGTDPTVNGETTSGIARFETSLNSGGFFANTSPVSYIGLSNGSQSFQVRAVDNAGNVGAPVSYTWIVDTISPTVAIVNKPASPGNSVANFSFTASDASSGLAYVEYRLDGGAYQTVTSPLQLTGMRTGTHTFDIRSVDTVGNVSTVATYTWQVQSEIPEVTSLTTTSTASNAGNFTYTVVFDHAVTGVDASDFSLTTTGPVQTPQPIVVSGSGTTYTVAVNGVAGEGTLRLNLADDDTIQSAGYPLAGVGASTIAGPSITIDKTAPTASFATTPAAISNTSSPTFQLTTIDPTSGGVASGIFGIERSLDGAPFAVSPNPFSLSGLADGPHQVKARPVDNAGNVGAEVTYDWAVDATPPTATILTTPPAFSNSTTATFSFSGSDPTSSGSSSGFNRFEYSTGGAFATATNPLTINLGIQGTYTFSLRSVDNAGNVSPTATYTWTIDTTAPTLVITPDGTTATGGSTITYTFAFSEDVVGFDASDVSATNGTKGALTTVNARTFTMPVTVGASGAFGVSVAAGAAADPAGNVSSSFTASSSNSLVSLAITPNSGFVTGGARTFTFNFGASVTGFTSTDVIVNNGTKGTLSTLSSSSYQMSITPTNNGLMTVMVPKAAATGLSPAISTAGAFATVTVDKTAPTVSITPSAFTTNTATNVLTFAFSEPVTFNDVNLIVSNGTRGTVTAIDSKTYTIPVTGTTDGTVTVTMNAGTATDLAGNGTPFTQATFTLDRIAPRVVVTPTGTAIKSSEPTTMTFTFTEPVTGFTASDVTLTNATAGTFTAVSSTVYTLVVTPTAPGPVTASVAAGALQDAAGNVNSAFSGSYVRTPTMPKLLSIVRSNATPAGPGEVSFDVTFSEAVTGVDAGDFALALSNGVTASAALVVTPIDAATYRVKATGVSGNGSLGLNFVDNHSVVSPYGTSLKPSAFDFGAGQLLSTGSTRKGVAADVNNDGKLDLVYPNVAAADIEVALGNGDGTFRNWFSFASTGNAFAIADLTGDGIPDIMATVSAGGVRLFTGVGDGTFLPGASIATSAIASDVAIADLNSDGVLDVLVGSGSTTGYVSVLKGNGNGTFLPQTTFFALSRPQDVAVADLNADSLPDIAVANGSLDQGGVLLANINGQYALTQGLSITQTGVDIAAGDLNGDGYRDLVAANSGFSPSRYAVYVNLGNGTFQNQQTYNSSVAPLSVDLADFDRDGELDLIMGNSSGGAPRFLPGGGNGTFGSERTFTGMASTFRVVAIADFDGDGDLDLATSSNSNVQIFTNTSSASLTGPTYTIDSTVPTLTISNTAASTQANVTIGVSASDPLVLGVSSGVNRIETSLDGAPFAVPSSYVLTGLSEGAHVYRARAVDNAGNVSATATYSWQVDITGPTPSIAPVATSANSFIVTFNFGENVTGFDTSDVTVTNGTKGTFTAVNGSTYTLVLTRLAAGDVTASVGANAAIDGAGNPNFAASASVGVPTIVSVSPTNQTLSAGGAVVITGTSLLGATSVLFGATAASFTINSASQITAIAPPATNAGAVEVVVTTPAGSSSTAGTGNDFSYFHTGPNILSNGGGPTAAINVPENTTAVTTVIPFDLDLPPESLTVSIDSTGGADFAKFQLVGNLLSFALAPNFEAPTDANADNVYQVTIKVTDTFGASVTQDISVTVTGVNEPPTITISGPATVEQGRSVVISGTVLNSSDPDYTPAGLTYSITTAPQHGRIELTTNPGQAIASFTQQSVNSGLVRYVHDSSLPAPDSFRYSLADGGEDGAQPATGVFNVNVQQGKPSVLGVVPSLGPTAGGQSVVLTGFAFTGATGVTFGGIAATSFTVNSDTQISVLSPAHIAGLVDVVVTNASGASDSSTTADDYVYKTPAVSSIVRSNPPGTNTNATSVAFTVTFNQPVTGVDAGDFQVDARSGLQIGSVAVAGSGTSYVVTVSGLRGTGPLQLSLIDNDTILASGAPLGGTGTSNGSFQGPSYDVALNPAFVAPNVQSITRGTPTDRFTVVFSEPVTGVDVSDFQVTSTGTATATIAQVTATNATTYVVRLTNFGGAGTIGLNLVDNGTIRDADNNRLGRATVAFGPSTASALSSGPNEVYVADFNRDGKADVIANGTGFNLLLGTGNGSFQSPTNVALPQDPQRMALGDANGDGVPDAFGVDLASNFVTVGLSHGDGTFKPITTTAVNSPNGIAIGDLDGDGKADLAVAVGGSGLAIKLGNGDGTFGDPYALAVFTQDANVVRITDVNGDGKADLLVSFTNSGILRLLVGNGNGTFQTPVSLASNGSPQETALGDVDNNGTSDVLVANTNGTLAMFLGNGDGTFRPLVTLASNASPTSLALSDFNGDDFLDVATANDTTSGTILQGNGNGTFKPQSAFPTGDRSRGVAIADFNGDGRPDIATADHDSNQASFRFGLDGSFAGPMASFDATGPTVASIVRTTPPSSITNGSTLTFTVTFSEAVTGVDTIDFAPSVTGNAAGTVTQVTASTGSVYVVTVSGVTGNGNLSLRLVDNGSIRDAANNPLTNAAGTIAFQGQQSFGSGASYSQAVGDVNGDGIADVVVKNANTIDVLIGNGAGGFTLLTSLPVTGPRTVALADVNRDGKLDVVADDWTSAGQIAVLLGNGNGTFQSKTTFDGGGYARSLAIADVSGDGIPDLAVVSYGGAAIHVLLGAGDGSFQPQAIPAVGALTSLAIGDVNGDGKPDLVVATNSYPSALMYVLLGNGNGSFQPRIETVMGFWPLGLTLADFNGDGKLDAVSGGKSTAGRIALGNGDGTFKPYVDLLTTITPRAVASGDFNSDGKTDLLFTDTTSDGVRILLGLGDGSFSTPLTVSMGAGSQPANVSSADLNGDGRLDVVTANVSGGVGVLLNATTGSFTGQPFVIDHTAPTVNIATTPPALTNSASATFSFAGTDANGIARFEYSLDGASIVTAANPLTLNNLSSGSHTIQVRSVDNAGNPSTAVSYGWSVDVTPPTLAITPNGLSSSANPITFTFTFSENVTGFDVNSVMVTNGSPGALTAINAKTYTLTVTPDGPGTVQVDVDPGAAIDAANNPSLAASASVVSGPVGLTIAPSGTRSNASSIVFTFTFADAVTGFDATDVSVANGTKGAFTGSGSSYSLVVTPNADGAVTASVLAGAAVNALGNPNRAASASVAIDRVAPALAITPNGALANLASITFTFAFAEPVVGFDASDVSVTNGTKGTFTVVDAATYRLDVTPLAPGAVAVRVAAGAAQDLTGNDNPAANASVVRSSPTVVSINRSGGAVAQAGAGASFDVTFSEDVTGVDNSDFALATTGTAAASGLTVTQVNGSVYQVAATGVTGNGTLGLNLLDDGSIVNGVGNHLTGNGAVALGQSISLAKSSKAAPADVDGDGKVDLIFASTNALAVSLGNGNGTFAAPTTFAPATTYASDFPVVLTTGDFNADGKVDFVTANIPTGMSIYLGNGNGTFKPGATFAPGAGAGVQAMGIADFNGDGKMDIAAALFGGFQLFLGNGNGTFLALTNFNTVTNDDLVVGDFNADGLPDVALAQDASRVSVLLSNGDGTFQPLVSYAVANWAISVAAGDVNKDGVLDLVEANWMGTPGLSLLIGNGNGTFKSQQFVPLGATPTAVEFADLNRDGNLDLVVQTYNNDVLRLALGNGNGTFQTEKTFAAGLSMNAIAIADVDADGDPDVIASGQTLTRVFLNSGAFTGQTYVIDTAAPTLAITPNGTSTNANPIAFTFTFNEPVTGFDAADVTVTNGTKGTFTAVSGSTYTLAVVPNADGAVTISVPVNAAQDAAGNVSPSASAAVTSDVTPPTLAVTPDGTTVGAAPITFTFTFSEPVVGFTASDVVLSTGTIAGFAASSASVYTLVVIPSASGAVTASVIAGAAQDAAGNNSSAASATVVSDQIAPSLMSIVQTTPSATLTNVDSITYTVTFSEAVTGVDAADFAVPTTGVIATSGVSVSGSGAIYRVTIGGIVGNGTVGLNFVDDTSVRDLAGNTLNVSQIQFKPFTSYASVAGSTSEVADFNSDGKPDVVMQAGTTINLFFGNGNGTFGPAQSLTAPVSSPVVLTADFNGDSIPDLVTCGSSGGTIAVLLGNGNGTFKAPITTAADVATTGFAVADLNADGIPDLALTTSTLVSTYVGNGNGTFKPRATVSNVSTNRAIVADVNNDRVNDVVVVTAASVSIFLGNGNGTLKPRTSFSATLTRGAFGDVNGDGNVDLLAITTSGVNQYLGNGNGTFKAATSFASANTPRTISLADLNGDGQLDLVVGKSTSTALSVFAGNGNGSFRAEQTFPGSASVSSTLLMSLADLNGDGRLDLVSAMPGSFLFDALLNAANGNLAGAVDTIDQTPPTVTIGKQPLALTLSTSASFSVSGVDPVAGAVSSGVNRVEYRLDGGAYQTTPNTFTLANLDNRLHQVDVRAIDNAGNVGVPTSVTWTVDTASPPSVASILRNGSPAPTAATTVSFSVLFNGTVTGVDAADFAVQATGTINVANPFVVTGSGDSYLVTLSGVSGDGSLQLILVDDDSIRADVNGLPVGGAGAGNGDFAGQSFALDHSGPIVTITSQPAAFVPVNSAYFAFTGADPVIGGVASGVASYQSAFDGGSFAAASSPVTFGNLSAGAHTFQVRAIDVLGNVGPISTYSWTIDAIAPSLVSIARSTPTSSVTNADSVTYVVTFSEAMTGVDAADFSVAKTGAVVTSGVSQVTGSGAVYNVTIAGIVGNGTVGLNFVDNGSVRDLAGNALAAAQVQFQPFAVYPVPSPRFNVAVADFNADGKPDVAEQSFNAIVVFPGAVNGTLGASQTLTTGFSANFAYAADFNGDSIPDIVSVGQNGVTIAVLLSNGNGTFKPAITTATDSQATGYAIADLNSDGKPDVVISTSIALSTYLGNGDGTFKPRTSVSSTTASTPIFADVNNDGKLDVIVLGTTFGVFLGNGDGTVKPRASVASSALNLAIDVGDVNGDGNADLIAVTSGAVWQYFGNGDGSFKSGTSFATADVPRSVLLADFNNDGKLDIVVGKSLGARFGLFAGNGNGTYRAEQTLTASGTISVSPTLLSAADMNGDGRPDLVASITGGGTLGVDVLLNSSKANLTGPIYSIDQTPPTLAITAQPPAFSINPTATFAFAAADPTVGGVSSGFDHVEYQLDGGGYQTASSPLTVTGLGTGAHHLDLRALDTAGNVANTAADWTVDLNGSPAVASMVRTTPASPNVNATSVAYTVVFDNPVSGVDASDFVATVTGAVAAAGPIAVSGSGDTYTVTVPGITGDGTLRLDLVDDDSILATINLKPLGGAGTGNGSFAGQTYLVDKTAPTATFATTPPALTNVTTAAFTFTGADPLVGGVASGVARFEYQLDAGSFLSSPGSANFAALTLGFHTVSVRAVDFAGNLGPTSSYSWTIEQTAPSLASIVRNVPSASVTNASSVSFVVTFSEPVTGVDAADFTPAPTGPVTATGVSVTGGGAVYVVAVNGIVGDGSVAITLLDNGSIRDLAGNLLDAPQSPLLMARQSIATGLLSLGIPAGDFNGDGKLDLSELGNGTSNVGILLGDGAGAFAAPVTTALGFTPNHHLVADVDADGKADLLVEGGSLLAVLLGNGNGTFRPKLTFALGSSARVIDVGDVDRDGKLDVVSGSFANRVDVLLGNGDGTFKPRTTFATLQTETIHLADVTNDGILDCLVANSASNGVDIHLGNGDGTFKAPTLITGNMGVLGLGDLDGNGALDMVTLNFLDYRVYLNNGDGTFKTPATYHTTHTLIAVQIADMNGDGKLDAVFGNSDFNTVSVRLGNGDGTFGADNTFASVPMLQSSLTIGDFNGDGRPDVAAQSQASGYNLLTSFPEAPTTGPSDFIDQTGPTATFTTQPVAVTNSVAAFSFDGNDPVVGGVSSGVDRFETSLDGAPFVGAVGHSAALTALTAGSHVFRVRAIDLAGNVGVPAAYSWTVDSTGPLVLSLDRAAPVEQTTGATSVRYAVTFDEPVLNVDAADFQIVKSGSVATTSLQVTGSGATYLVTIGGISGDGSLGLNLVDNHTITDLYGNALANSLAAAAFESAQTFAALPAANASATADLDGDGYVDLIQTNGGSNVVTILRGDGEGGLGAPVTYAVGALPVAVVVADVDGSGKPDLIVVDRNGAGISLLLGNGDGTFQPQQTLGTGPRPTAAAFGDVNGDGKADVVVVNLVNNSVAVLLGNGNGSFQPLRTFTTGASPDAVALGDVNGDGKLDVVTANQTAASVSVLLGNGDGSFKTQTAYTVAALPSALVLKDLSGDGALDIVTANKGSSSISVLLGNGDGSFKAQQTFAVGSLPKALAVGDVSGDGVVDLVVANSGSGTVSIFRGNGDGTFQPQQTFAGGASPSAISLADLDGDAKLDVIVASDTGSTTSVLISNAAGNATGQTYAIDHTAPATSGGSMLTPTVTGISLPAQVTSVVPFVGPTSGGTVVVISGVNFLGVTSVKFGGVAAVSYVVNSATQITAVAPPESSGLVDVSVTTPLGTTNTASTADDYSYATPSIVSVAVNGGAIAARDRLGKTPSLAGQNSVVTQILVTFNQRVTLDADAFGVVSTTLSAQGAAPTAANVSVRAEGVAGSGDSILGYVQYVLTFVAGGGVNSFDYSPSGGTAFTTLKDGSWQLLTTGSKVHAGGDTGADRADAFWSLYGAANPGDVHTALPGSSEATSVMVDGLALSDTYAAFGSRNGDDTYRSALDWNLDGFVDGIDLTHLYGNFGTIWRF